MIKLERNFTPLCLHPNEVARLSMQYATNGEAVWNIDALKEALLELSNTKCAYCECELSKESSYMEVEHFRDKKRHPHLVLDWGNLLPSCKRCNVAKGGHDVSISPIIDPCVEDPKGHLKFNLYHLKSKTTLGQNSIDVLDLNNSSRLVKVRFQLGEGVLRQIESIADKFELYKVSATTRNKNKLMNSLEGLLREAQPNSPYAATVATIIHSESSFEALVKGMILAGAWNNLMQDLHNQSKLLKLELG